MVKFKKIFLIFCFNLLSQLAFAQNNEGQSQVLKSKTFLVCGKKMQLEIADTPESRRIGLMHRKGINKNLGMLFVFPDLEIREFWMRNVPFDIDIAYFDGNGKLIRAITMAGTSPLMRDETLVRYSSLKPAQYAVESAKGFLVNSAPSKCVLSPLPRTKE